MADFFRSMLKTLQQKKILFSVLLFSFLIGISLPNVASANWFTDISSAVSGVWTGTGEAINAVANASTFIVGLLQIGWSVASEAMSGSTNWPATIIVLISNLISTIFFYIAYGSALLFRFVLDQMINNPDLSITRRAEFITAWNVIKSWANMLIVLGFIAASTMMILGFMVDKAKALLPKIIITAILINFSVVLVGLFIDSSNIIMRSLTVGGDQEANIVLIINDVWNETIWELEPIAETNIYKAFAYFGINLLFDGLYFFVALILFAFSLTLIQRYVLLAILFVLSPLAFALNVFPYEKAQKLFGDWWNQFLKYCFIGLGAAFFLNLSVSVLRAYTWAFTGDTTTALINLTFQFIIVVGFLGIGIHLTYKSSGPIAGAVMAIGTKIASAIITGGTSAAISKTASATGMSGMAKRAKNATSDFIKHNDASNTIRDLFYGAGTSAKMMKKTQEERLGANESPERIKALTPEKRQEIATSDKTFTEQHVQDKANAIKQMVENGELKNLSKPERLKAMQFVASRDGSTNIFSKDPDMAHLDTNKTDELLRTNKAKTQTEAENIARRDAFDHMDTKDIREKNDIDLVELAEKETAEGARALEEAIRRGILDRVKGGDIDEQVKLLSRAKATYGSGAKKSAAKLDPRLAAFTDTEKTTRADELVDTYGIPQATADDQAQRESDQKVSEAYEKLVPEEIGKLSKKAINMDLVFNTTAKKITESGKKLSKEQIKKFKDMLDDIENEINMATDPEVIEDLEKKFEAIVLLK